MTMFAFALKIISQDRIQTSLSTALLSPTKLGLSNLLRHSKLFFSAVFVDADEAYYGWAILRIECERNDDRPPGRCPNAS